MKFVDLCDFLLKKKSNLKLHNGLENIAENTVDGIYLVGHTNFVIVIHKAWQKQRKLRFIVYKKCTLNNVASFLSVHSNLITVFAAN